MNLDSACNKAQQFLEKSEADRLKVAEQEADKCPDCEAKDAEIKRLKTIIDKYAIHKLYCEKCRGVSSKCTCGFEQALKGGE